MEFFFSINTDLDVNNTYILRAPWSVHYAYWSHNLTTCGFLLNFIEWSLIFHFLCCLFLYSPTYGHWARPRYVCYAVEQPWRWRRLHSRTFRHLLRDAADLDSIWPRLRWQMFLSAIQSTLVRVTDGWCHHRQSVNQDFIIDNLRRTWRQTDVSTDCHHEACILSFGDYVLIWDSEYTTGLPTQSSRLVHPTLCQVST